MNEGAGSSHLVVLSSLLSLVPYSSMIAAKAPAISSSRGYGQGRQRPSYILLRMKKLFPEVPWQNSPSHWPQIHSMANLSQSMQGEREGHVWLGPISIHPPGHCGQSLPLTYKSCRLLDWILTSLGNGPGHSQIVDFQQGNLYGTLNLHPRMMKHNITSFREAMPQ